MYYPRAVIKQMDELARFVYIDAEMSARWNKNRRPGELRLPGGWAWIERHGTRRGYCFRTISAARYDMQRVLVLNQEVPNVITARHRIRVVAERAA